MLWFAVSIGDKRSTRWDARWLGAERFRQITRLRRRRGFDLLGWGNRFFFFCLGGWFRFWLGFLREDGRRWHFRGRRDKNMYRRIIGKRCSHWQTTGDG